MPGQCSQKPEERENYNRHYIEKRSLIFNISSYQNNLRIIFICYCDIKYIYVIKKN